MSKKAFVLIHHDENKIRIMLSFMSIMQGKYHLIRSFSPPSISAFAIRWGDTAGLFDRDVGQVSNTKEDTGSRLEASPKVVLVQQFRCHAT